MKDKQCSLCENEAEGEYVLLDTSGSSVLNLCTLCILDFEKAGVQIRLVRKLSEERERSRFTRKERRRNYWISRKECD